MKINISRLAYFSAVLPLSTIGFSLLLIIIDEPFDNVLCAYMSVESGYAILSFLFLKCFFEDFGIDPSDNILKKDIRMMNVTGIIALVLVLFMIPHKFDFRTMSLIMMVDLITYQSYIYRILNKCSKMLNKPMFKITRRNSR